MSRSDIRLAFVRGIRTQFPFLKGQRLLLAVSGGLDSMAMFHLFLEARKTLAVDIAVAHVNHNLRAAARRDLSFVDNFCQTAGLPCYVAEIPKEFWKPAVENREDRARKERYRLLSEIAKREHFQHIATAHQRDDQIETLLMRLFDRGTGIHGLAGIPPVIRQSGVIFVRPLLGFSRKELEGYMREKGYAWREDESNRDLSLRRNFYRQRILPFLREKLGDSFEGSLLSLAEEAHAYREVQEAALSFFWDRHRVSGQNNLYVLGKNEISCLTSAYLTAALAYLFRMVRGYTYGARTLRDIERFLRAPGNGKCEYGPVRITRGRAEVFFLVGEVV